MTLDDVIRLARKVGLPNSDLYHGNLETFAKLVAEHEREACALICESYADYDSADGGTHDFHAKLIRARGQA